MYQPRASTCPHRNHKRKEKKKPEIEKQLDSEQGTINYKTLLAITPQGTANSSGCSQYLQQEWPVSKLKSHKSLPGRHRQGINS